MSCKILSGIASLILMGAVGSLQAAPITLPDVADSTVRETFGVQGGELFAKWGGSDTSGSNRKSYIRFDSSAVTGSVLSATLNLIVSVNNGGGSNPLNPDPQSFTLNVYGLNDGATAGGGKLGEDWAESSITWDNAPANIASGTGAGQLVSTGSGTANGGQAVFLGQLDITTSDSVGAVVSFSNAALVNFLNTDTNGVVTIIISAQGWTGGGGTSSQSSANLGFAPKESTTYAAPSLSVVTVPEPTTAALLSLGVLGRIRRRVRVA